MNPSDHHYRTDQCNFPDLAKRLVSFDSIMREPLPALEWLVDRLIPTGTRTILYGVYGSMKSWILLDLSLHIAAGLEWLENFAIPQAKSVLYIDEEMSTRELYRRVKRLGEGIGLHERSIPFMAASHLNRRFTEESVEGLLAALQRANFDPEVIVVETLRRVLTGSENESADVGEFWRSVGPIFAAGKTLIISHHMKKEGSHKVQSLGDRASGSTDILAGVETGYAIAKKKDELTITCVKNREAKEHPPFQVRLESDGTDDGVVVLRYVGGASDSEWSTKDKEKRASEAIVAFLTKQPGYEAQRGDILADLTQQGISERTGERALRALYEAGVVEKTDRGLYRLRTELKAI